MSRKDEVTMSLQAATGYDAQAVDLEVLPTSQVGGRVIGKSITESSITRSGVVMTYDRAKVAVLMPVPESHAEAFDILRRAKGYPTDRALKTAVRRKILKGSIVGVISGRQRKDRPRTPDAFLVPYPHTAIVAEWVAEKVWGIVEGFHQYSRMT